MAFPNFDNPGVHIFDNTPQEVSYSNVVYVDSVYIPAPKSEPDIKPMIAMVDGEFSDAFKAFSAHTPGMAEYMRVRESMNDEFGEITLG